MVLLCCSLRDADVHKRERGVREWVRGCSRSRFALSLL